MSKFRKDLREYWNCQIKENQFGINFWYYCFQSFQTSSKHGQEIVQWSQGTTRRNHFQQVARYCMVEIFKDTFWNIIFVQTCYLFISLIYILPNHVFSIAKAVKIWHWEKSFCIRISIVHYDSFDWKLKDGADINRALVYFKRTPPTVDFLHYLIW